MLIIIGFVLCILAVKCVSGSLGSSATGELDVSNNVITGKSNIVVKIFGINTERIILIIDVKDRIVSKV